MGPDTRTEARRPGALIERPAAALHRVGEVFRARPVLAAAALGVRRATARIGRGLAAPGQRFGRRIRARSGPWRVAIAEASMVPAIEPGDWLLVDPTIRHWPRRGTVVLFREPGSDLLVIKRVVGRPRDTVPTDRGLLSLGPREAWLEGDAPASHDSRHYGPVEEDRLAGRAWFRYGPIRRIGPIRTRSNRAR